MPTRYAVKVCAGYAYPDGEVSWKNINTADSMSDLAGLLDYVRGYPVIECRLIERDETGATTRSELLGTRIETFEDEDDEFVEAYDVRAELDSIYRLVDGLVALANERMGPAADAIREKVREKIANVRVRV